MTTLCVHSHVGSPITMTENCKKSNKLPSNETRRPASSTSMFWFLCLVQQVALLVCVGSVRAIYMYEISMFVVYVFVYQIYPNIHMHSIFSFMYIYIQYTLTYAWFFGICSNPWFPAGSAVVGIAE